MTGKINKQKQFTDFQTSITVKRLIMMNDAAIRREECVCVGGWGGHIYDTHIILLYLSCYTC